LYRWEEESQTLGLTLAATSSISYRLNKKT
jgi:hypothetical protein